MPLLIKTRAATSQIEQIPRLFQANFRQRNIGNGWNLLASGHSTWNFWLVSKKSHYKSPESTNFSRQSKSRDSFSDILLSPEFSPPTPQLSLNSQPYPNFPVKGGNPEYSSLVYRGYSNRITALTLAITDSIWSPEQKPGDIQRLQGDRNVYVVLSIERMGRVDGTLLRDPCYVC